MDSAHSSAICMQLPKTTLSYPTTPTWSFFCATMENQLALTCAFSAKQSRQRRRAASGTSRPLEMNLVRTFATIYFSCTRYYDVTPLPCRLYGLGKALSLKIIASSSLFRDKARQFGKQDATIDGVVDAGDAARACLYNGKDGDNLDDLRYSKCCSNVATNKARIRPRHCPYFCGDEMWVYLQVQHLLSERDRVGVDGDGWKSSPDYDIPIPPSPDDLLRIIRCNCTTDCSTARCSCSTHNMLCCPACGQCRGVGFAIAA